MRNWKRILAFGLGFTLIFGQAAYAEITITPLDLGNVTAETAAPGLAGGAGTAAAPSTAGTSTAAAPSTAGTGTGGANTQAEIEAPIVVADGAVLMDASTGAVLFGKNQDKQYYPASITKVMTALVVLEQCDLNDTVTFSSTATTNLESGAVSLGIAEGDKLTVEQCLYGLLLKSANEIGNGLAEHVAGSISAFADKMNAKAKELGCKNTHFANPHGLNDSTHKTTPYDMALILRAALQNAAFRKIDTTTSYQFPATKNAAARTITMGHKMMYSTDSRYYPGIIGGKTGYTSLAGNTLVTGVEKNGVRLVAVVMKAKGTQYTDTKAMLDYGFNNYTTLTGTSGGTSTSAGSASSAADLGSGNSTSTLGPAAETTAAGAAEAPAQAAAADTAQSQLESSTGWKQETQGWTYLKVDGSCAANEWLTVDGQEYWFDNTAYMATGWRHFANGAWYYFSPDDGHMVSGTWVVDGGYWYYVGADGVLLTNTMTPDGYPVDENGIWIQQ